MSFFSYLLEQEEITQDMYDVLLTKNSYDERYDVLIESIYEETLCSLLSRYSYIPLINAEQQQSTTIDYKYFDNIPAIPWYTKDNVLYVATYNTDDIDVKDRISYYAQSTGFDRVEYLIAPRTKIRQCFTELTCFSKNENLNYTLILNDALNANASDVHITPYAKSLKIMFRIDGDLHDYKLLPIEKHSPLAIALKVKAKLDIAESRRPQSGQFCYSSVDFRVSTHPTAYGENIVIRILNKDKQLIKIEALGFTHNDVEYLKNITKQKQGLIIFCGPTGSGKSTSIYALIDLMDKKTRNIMTLEDPIEYNIQDVRQTEIIPGVIDFVTGIRSILRQDPDVVLIGEIRDEETAQMAIRASMTGHLVLTTIHANDCLCSISRLKHFNIPSSFIAENLTAVVSQRLVKKTNNQGRTVVAEVLKPDANFKDLISNDAIRSELLSYAIKNLGYKPLNISDL